MHPVKKRDGSYRTARIAFASSPHVIYFPAYMAVAAKIPVFFIATKTRQEPVVVNFYTKQGKPVAFAAVQKVKTKEGVRFFAKAKKK